MRLLFVADPLEAFNIKKDTTFAMMREAARRGHALFACEVKDLMWERGAKVATHVRAITLTGVTPVWFNERQRRARRASASSSPISMRW